MKNIAVIGSGSWGTALAIHLASKGYFVKIWSFKKEEADELNNKRKCVFLPDAIIPDNVICDTNIENVVKDVDLILHVTPSKVVREVFKTYKDYVGSTPIVICSKGFEKDSLMTLDKVFEEELQDVKVLALSGPSYAEEVANHIPTALVLASRHEDILKQIQEVFMNEYMRIYISKDIIGVEVGGALKNIIALCNGVCTQMKMGSNTTAALITRGLFEISRLGEKMGASNRTFYGLSGLGDLILTCQSDQSRNRRAGKLIGQGYTINQVKEKIGMTIESIDNIDIAKQLCTKYEVEMPIVDTVYEVLYENLNLEDAIKSLMTRGKKYE